MDNFSKEPAFNLLPLSGSDIYDVTFRLVANPYEHNIKNSGTCSLIAANLAITAAHVIQDFIDTYGISSDFEIKCQVWAVQITNNSSLYAIWSVKNMWFCPYSDIAVLHLFPYDENAGLLK